MSVNTLMKNIYTFANIVNQACGDTVKCWSERSVNNAFNWAAYCQQVHSEMKGKPFEEEMNKHIKGLTHHLSPPSCVELDFPSLENAETLLMKVLLRNPLTPKTVVDIVLSRYQGSPNETSAFIQDCSEIARDLATMRISERLMTSLQIPVEACRVQSEASVLLQTLIQQREKASSEDRFVKYITGVLGKISSQKNGWAIILHLLLAVNARQDFSSSKSKVFVLESVHEFILQWINQEAVRNETNFVNLFSVNCDILCQVSSHHAPFCRLYVQHLVNCAMKLQIDYTTNSSQLYMWRLPPTEESESAKDFDQLTSEFKMLLKCCSKNSVEVSQTLKNLAEESYVNVFRDLLGNAY